MNYRIVEENGFYLIEVSGKTRKNEAVMARKCLFPYLKETGMRVIIDMKELEKFEPITVVGVLSSIRKEINLLRGDLKLCSLNPEIMKYITQNRLDCLFHIYENRETAKKESRGK